MSDTLDATTPPVVEGAPGQVDPERIETLEDQVARIFEGRTAPETPEAAEPVVESPAVEALPAEPSDAATPPEAPSSEGGVETGEGGAEVEGGSTPPGFDNPPSYLVNGMSFSADQIQGALRTAAWFQDLPTKFGPDVYNRIENLLSGQYVLAPAIQTPAPPSSPSEPVEEYLDTRAEAEIKALRAELDSVKQSILPIEQRTFQTEQQRVMAEVDAVVTEFATSRQLSDDERTALVGRALQSGMVPALNQRLNNPAESVRQALDYHYWTDETLRNRATAAQAQATADSIVAARAEQVRKEQQMTALAGSGGSAPRQTLPPSTPQQRREAIVAELAQAINGNGSQP